MKLPILHDNESRATAQSNARESRELQTPKGFRVSPGHPMSGFLVGSGFLGCLDSVSQQAPWPRDVQTMKARAWRTADAGPESSWRYTLPSRCAGAVVDRARALATGGVPLVDTRLADSDRLGWSGDFAGLADELENGRGFAIVHASPEEERLPLETQLALYWAVGQVLGEPVDQNVAGARLYDVRDTGQSISQGARFSVTNYESTFHTDASFEDGVVDYVGLLCVQAAKSGGCSQLVSGYSAAAELAQADPAAIEVLMRPFHVDRRGGVRPGETPTTERPVLRAPRRRDSLPLSPHLDRGRSSQGGCATLKRPIAGTGRPRQIARARRPARRLHASTWRYALRQ